MNSKVINTNTKLKVRVKKMEQNEKRWRKKTYSPNACYSRAVKLCKAIREGKNVAEDIAKIEPYLKNYCKERRETMQEQLCFRTEDFVNPQDALYEISPAMKKYWDSVYPLLETPESKYMALLRFVNAYQKCLGIPHTESIHILKEIGWTPTDIMATYLDGRLGDRLFPLSPDVVAKAVQEDMDTAVHLMEREGHDGLFTHGYSMYHQFWWIDFMYLFVKYEDRTFLTTQHKSKRLCKHCGEILEKLEQGAAMHEDAEIWTDLPDFSIFDGATLVQKHLLASAAGQRLCKGNDWSSYVMSYHVVDEQHGYGAALCFNALLKGPEYYNKETTVREVCFYRFDYFMPFDHVPESWRCSPTELPEDFVRKAYRSFCKLAGLEKKK